MTPRLCIYLVYLVGLMAACARAASPLADYVYRADGAMRFRNVSSEHFSAGRFTLHTFLLTSQRWDTGAETHAAPKERPADHEWHHWLRIFEPDEVDAATVGHSIMFIDSELGSAPGPDSTAADVPLVNEMMVQLVASTRAVVASVSAEPTNPLTFVDDPEQSARHEDSIVAWTVAQFLRADSAKAVNPELLSPFTSGGVLRRVWGC